MKHINDTYSTVDKVISPSYEQRMLHALFLMHYIFPKPDKCEEILTSMMYTPAG